MQHPPGDPVSPAEKPFSDTCTADSHAIEFNGRGSLDAEAIIEPRLAKKLEITQTIAAESKIITHFEMTNAEAFDQHGVDERRCAQLLQTPIEGKAKDKVDSLCLEQLELFAQTRQTRRCALGIKIFPGLRLKNNDTTRHLQLSRPLAKALEYRLMATVNAVEITDRSDAPPMVGAKIM